LIFTSHCGISFVLIWLSPLFTNGLGDATQFTTLSGTSSKDERLEYKTLAKYILQVNNNDKLQRAKLNDIILSN